jgi:hypothetical protein
MTRKETLAHLEKLNQEINRLEAIESQLKQLPKLHEARGAFETLLETIPEEAQPENSPAPTRSVALTEEQINSVRLQVTYFPEMRSCGEIAKECGLPNNVVSMVLRKMVAAGMVNAQGHGRSKTYYVHVAPVAVAQDSNGSESANPSDPL